MPGTGSDRRIRLYSEGGSNMPENKVQGTVFGILMSYVMAYGMEVYNVAIKEGFNLNQGGFSTMVNHVFFDALIEASYMGLFVFITSSLFGNRIGASFAARHTDPKKDNPYFCRVMRQAGTVAVMCPTMSFIATILFNLILAHQSPVNIIAIWVGTVLKNFPMAFFWNMFAAAPFCHLIFDTYNNRKKSGIKGK
jgi:hypothetical protein